jgi:hypothetical protein
VLGRRDHKRLAVVDEAEMADEPFVEDRIDRAAVINAALGSRRTRVRSDAGRPSIG